MTSVVDASQPGVPVQNTDQVAADNKDHLHSILHTIKDFGPKSAEVRTSPRESETPCNTGTLANFTNFPGRPQTPRNGLRRPGGQGVVGSNPASPTNVMSRDMLIGCPGTCLFLGEFVTLRHAAFSVSGAWSGFDAAGLAVFVGVDGQFADDFAGVAVDHEDV